MTQRSILATAVISGALVLPLSFAGAQQNDSDSQMASECLLDLNRLAGRMQEDQFWLSGWGGAYGAPAPQSTRAPASPAPDAGAEAEITGSTTAGGADPRGAYQGIYSPRHQIRTLYSAARVLAHRGEEDGCAYVVGQLSAIYDQHIQQLTDAGVDPASVTTWRQEQVALAKPLSEVQGMSSYRLDDLTGTDVRNMQDENLGTVSDVLIEPGNGEASYVLIARGGFLGMGEEYIAVPWDQLHATPGLELVVLDQTPAELEVAPTVDPERFRDPTTKGEERNRTNEFWSDRG